MTFRELRASKKKKKLKGGNDSITLQQLWKKQNSLEITYWLGILRALLHLYAFKVFFLVCVFIPAEIVGRLTSWADVITGPLLFYPIVNSRVGAHLFSFSRIAAGKRRQGDSIH